MQRACVSVHVCVLCVCECMYYVQLVCGVCACVCVCVCMYVCVRMCV